MRQVRRWGTPSSLSRIATGISLLLFLSAANSAELGLIWSGTIQEVFEDTGTTSFSGTMVGDPFSGGFLYYDEPSINETCDADTCEWFWDTGEAGGVVAPGPGPVPGVFLAVEDNQDLTGNPGDLFILNAILDPDIDTTTPFDLWEMSSEYSSGASDALFFAIDFITLDTTIYTGTSFRAMPPTIAAADAAAFLIQQTTSTGSFFAVGLLDSVDVQVIPVPAAAWLFGSALGMLDWARRRGSPES